MDYFKKKRKEAAEFIKEFLMTLGPVIAQQVSILEQIPRPASPSKSPPHSKENQEEEKKEVTHANI